MSGKYTLEELYWEIDNEGFVYYFSMYGPVAPEDVPEEIRDLWAEAIARANDLRETQERLMPILEAATND